MRRVFLCRHGQDQDNAAGQLNGHRDEPLTELGRSQAAAVAAKIAAEYAGDGGIDVILTSPLQRAHTTANAVGDAIGVSPVVHAGLIERDFGVLSGRPYADITKLATKTVFLSSVTYFLDGEGVESFDSCFDRAKRVFAELDAAYAGKSVLLVCHGDIGKMLMAVRKQLPWRDALATPFIGNTDVIEL